MKGQDFFYVGLGALLLALLVAYGQAPIAEPEPGQPAPVEVLAPQAEASGQNNIEALPTAGVEPHPLAWPPRPTQFRMADAEVTSLDETAIDPADRKFFSPGYGTQTVMSREVEVLPTVVKDEVDPDEDIGLLEFFSPGYGAISGGSKEAEVLPTMETDMDGDLGLMEFFIIPNEAGAPQAIETDADQDIGLMEFRP